MTQDVMGRVDEKAWERFWSKVEPTGFCWLWTAGVDSSGYGVFSMNRRNQFAHRLSYEMLVGLIPDGLQIDHLCRTRSCVNPDHLEPVTAAVNTRRGFRNPSRKQGECLRGHALTPENIYFADGRRRCRACNKQKQTLYQERIRKTETFLCGVPVENAGLNGKRRQERTRRAPADRCNRKVVKPGDKCWYHERQSA